MYYSYNKKVFWLIGISVLLKIIVAALLELGNDEVYYWTYAIAPDWNYFDHPPMVGWLIRLSTLQLHWVSEISIRLGAIISAALSTWFIFKLGKLLANERVGWLAALLYTFSVYTGFIAGLFILPDSPQMVFWTGSLYLMAYLFLKRADEQVGVWLLLGLMIGLATLCKIHGLYLWAGFGMFLLFTRIKWLLNWRLYLGFIITAICVLPVLYWNIQNNFITYRFHSERVTHTSLQWDMLGREIGGEVLYQNPVIFIIIIAALVSLVRGNIRFQRKRTRLWLIWMSLPMLLLFWGIALFNPTLPHWSGPAYIPLFFIGALYLEQKSAKKIPFAVLLAGILVVIVLTAGVLLIRFAPMNFGSQRSENYGEYGPTLDLSGWTTFSISFDSLRKADIQSGNMRESSPLLVDKWFPGGHLEFYTVRKSGITLLGVGSLVDLHQFAWLNKKRIGLKINDNAYCIVPSNLPIVVQEKYGKLFDSIAPPVRFQQIRGGQVVRYFDVYRLIRCHTLPQPLLP